MIEDYLVPGAYQVTTAPKKLYDAVPASSPITLVGSAPSTAFKCEVTVSASGSHTDCVGRVTIGSENFDFLAAGTKRSTVNLSALPIVTYANLDCKITIECIDSGGAPIQTETLTAILTLIEPHTSGIMNAQGIWTSINDTQIFSDTELAINDIVRKGTKDYRIKKVDENDMLGDEVEYYTYLA